MLLVAKKKRNEVWKLDHVYYSKNGENWVDISNVPLKVWQGKQIYDWRNCTEWIEVPFKYEGLQDVILLRYESTGKNNKRYVKISYECCSIVLYSSDLKRVSLGGVLNKVPVKYPDLIGHFKNGFQEAKKYRSGSQYRHGLQCINCKYEKQMEIFNFTQKGFTCPKCSSCISFPERFTSSLLDEIGFEYEIQKRFEGKNWRFDFYVPHMELVIEVHGSQHFNDAWTTKDEVVVNDNNKRKFIKFELGLNYAAIDISVSEPYYAWSMLEQNEHLESYMQNINYDVVVERCNDSVLNKNHNDIIRDYERGMRLFELSRKYEIDRSTLKYRLLKNDVYKKSKSYKAPVICTTTDERFESASQAYRQTGIGYGNISTVCQGKRKSAGKTPDGRKRVWMYLEDYEKQLKVN